VRALPTSLANDLLGMMRAVVDEGTGQSLRARFALAGDLAGKTGTSQDNADGWFILMRPDLVAGAWVGFNDQRVTLRSAHWGQGSRNALLIVGDFARAALRSRLVDGKARFPSPRAERAGADPNDDALVPRPVLPNGQWHFVPGFEPPNLLPPFDDGSEGALQATGAIVRAAGSSRERGAPISESEWMLAFPRLREIDAPAR
jgi:membrane peptidoglycan carboxypeptidase